MRPLLFGLILLTACSSPPDSGTNPLVDEAESRLGATPGGQIVLRALEAHGGLEAWHAAPTSSYTWEYSNHGSQTRFKTHMVVDNHSRLAYHDLLEYGTPDSVETVEARFAWNGTEAWMHPPEQENPNPMFWATTGYYFSSIPFVLADPGLQYEVLPVDTLDGRPHDMVRVSFDEGVGYSDGDWYTLYVDQETDLVTAIRYTVTYGRGRPAPDATPRENLFYYQDLVTVDGLTVPTRFRGYRYADGLRGDLRNEAWVTDISFRRPFDSSRLAVPEGAQVVLPPVG
ncbi:MAG: hypothetical protein HKN29_14240 [Rhodothermales bacterium]|nr:hypothetical protein [Rhodothermales bacterium]